MKFWMIFAAVVLICQAAKVPQEDTHQVVVPVPSDVLAAPPPPSDSSKHRPTTETPAQVEEVAKDHEHKLKGMKKLVTTEQPAMKSMTHPTAAEMNSMKRKTRAIPLTDNASIKSHAVKHNDMIMRNDMWAQRKHTMDHKMHSHRSMRSIKATTKPSIKLQAVTVTENPIVVKTADTSSAASSPANGGISSIDPCDLLCTKFEFEPICATNGLCLHDFPNQCILETYNCRHPKGKFAATKDDRCQMHPLNKCDESEMI